MKKIIPIIVLCLVLVVAFQVVKKPKFRQIRNFFIPASNLPPQASSTPQVSQPNSTTTPTTAKVDYQAAYDYSAKTNGTALLVQSGGKIVFEKYSGDMSVNAPHRLASGSKSFSCAIAVAAIQDGILSGFNENVSKTITEWIDPMRTKVTVRDLLTFTSGIPGGDVGKAPSYADAIKVQSVANPGVKFQYGPSVYQIFGEMMTRKLAAQKKDPYQYLTARVLNPIGLKVAEWRYTDGDPNLPSGAYITARDWAKYGELIKNKGKGPDGKQILDSTLLAECFKGTTVNPVYGFTWWLNSQIPPNMDPASIGGVDLFGGDTFGVGGRAISAAPSDMVFAAGAGKQRLYIIPSRDLVIVRFGEGGPFDDSEFMKLLFGTSNTTTIPVATSTPIVPVPPVPTPVPPPVIPPPTNLKATQYPNVQYKTVTGIDKNALSLDVYVPARTSASQKFPVMMYVHGGGFNVGDKAKNMTYKPSYFNNLGFVFVSVNYRLTPTATYPNNFQDVADAISFISKNANTYSVDSSRISLLGHSAGTQMVSTLSTNGSFLANAGLSLDSIRCTVANDTEGYDISDDMDKKAYQAEFPNNVQTMTSASPLKNISAGKNIPDFLIIMRGIPERITEATLFRDTLKNAGYYTQLLESKQYDHEGVNNAIGNPSDTEVTPVLTSFLKSRCQ